MKSKLPVAVVSGAERGLGEEVALELGDCGMLVLPTARDLALSRKVAQKIKRRGGRAAAAQLDVIDQSSVNSLVAKVKEEFGRIDVLVNNAGICIDDQGDASNADIDVVKETLDTNLFGAWRISQAFAPMMRIARTGRIINISSGMGQLETMGSNSPGYRLSKAALNALTCMLAVELESTNIFVNSVEPGWIRTAMGGPEAPRSVEDGADTVVWLATSSTCKTGCFYFDRRLIPW